MRRAFESTPSPSRIIGYETPGRRIYTDEQTLDRAFPFGFANKRNQYRPIVELPCDEVSIDVVAALDGQRPVEWTITKGKPVSSKTSIGLKNDLTEPVRLRVANTKAELFSWTKRLDIHRQDGLTVVLDGTYSVGAVVSHDGPGFWLF